MTISRSDISELSRRARSELKLSKRALQLFRLVLNACVEESPRTGKFTFEDIDRVISSPDTIQTLDTIRRRDERGKRVFESKRGKIPALVLLHLLMSQAGLERVLSPANAAPHLRDCILDKED